MTLSGLIFFIALIPQLIKNIKQKSAKQLSWLFLLLYIIALTISAIGLWGSNYKLAVIINIFIILEYILIAAQKYYFGVHNEKN
jgi:uncharacterized protein with PQ loop repeat